MAKQCGVGVEKLWLLLLVACFSMYEETEALDLAGIKHRRVEVNGIKMHIAEKGEGPVVLFLHGFPEIWYTWRHQILSLSSRGYRAVAPDLRGYGYTDAPSQISNYTAFHIVGDLVALLDTLGIQQVFLVAHDWGAIIGWYLCMFRPQRVKAYVCLSVPFLRRDPNVRTVDGLCALYGDDYYICRFQKPGDMEAQMAQVGTEYVLKNILTTRRTGPPILPKGEFGTGFNPNMSHTLPSWLTQDDLRYYVSNYDKTGFTGGLNYYRNLNLNWELTAPWTGMKIKVPVKFITGELDSVYTSPNFKEYIDGGGFKEDVPNLEQVIVQKGVAHFNNQEAADEINDHIYDFISKESALTPGEMVGLLKKHGGLGNWVSRKMVNPSLSLESPDSVSPMQAELCWDRGHGLQILFPFLLHIYGTLF
ncbi:ephA, partial [Mucuna pruriens]